MVHAPGSAAGVLSYGGLNLQVAKLGASLWTDHVLLGQNEWVAAHSNSTKRITRLEDGAISTSTFDHVAINGVGEVLTAECMHSSPSLLSSLVSVEPDRDPFLTPADAPNLVLHLFPTLSAALAHSSELSPSSLPLAFPLPPPSATHPLALHPGLSHFLLHAPPHHLLALSDNRFSQSSTHASPLPGLPPTPVPELEGMEPIACAAGGRHSAAVSAGGEVWAWGSGTGEKGKVVLEDHDEVEVRGVSCGQEHTVLWTDEGVWAAGASKSR